MININERDMVLRMIDMARVSLLAQENRISPAEDALSVLTKLYFDFRPLETDAQVRGFREHLERIKRRPNYGHIELVNFTYDEVIGGTSQAFQAEAAKKSEAVGNLITYLSRAADDWIERLEAQANIEHLREIIPSKKTGPFNFRVQDGRLVVAPHDAEVKIEGSIASARAALLQQGERLINDLLGSNTQPYLRATLEAVQEKLPIDSDIIQLGLLNISFENATSGATEELNSVLAAVLQAHAAGIRHYLAQFPEWKEFSTQAADLEIAVGNLNNVASSVDELADQIEKENEVDEAVPRSLRFLTSLVRQPGAELRRVGLALVTTIESLSITVFGGVLHFVTSTSKETLDGASKHLSKVLAVAVAVTCLHVTATLAEWSGVTWLKPAAEIILKSEAVLARL
ncbi:hypothetical protein [Rhizobium rhizogenes]|uniref:hypothetical protein n=1 Tax=Rhizobium rhizogenes TaxID=359 RepID=UPI0015724B33|nr:hypothetical protein [Rhizobium rhizogenes]NTF51010.1 hypothetical protein [Rhizobium rhizogenes]NTH08388.1 hypothetical protein [Rhizobium rhizogenes]